MATATDDTTIRLAEIYRFLAHSMQYPDETFLAEPKLSFLYTLLEQLGRQDYLNDLQDHLATDPDPLESLQVDHTRLFINGLPATISPPYGSVYMPGEGMLMSRSTEKVLDFYRLKGFDLAAKDQIPDHLVTELEFLSLLAEEGKTEDESLFLNRFFRPWFEIFHNKVIEGADHPFYRIMVRLIDFFTTEGEQDGVQSDETKIPAVRLSGSRLSTAGENRPGPAE